MELTCRYFASVLLSALALLANAKEDYNSSNSPVQFIQNKGQITDQHGIVRRDIDVKIEANGVTMFLGDGEMHYQWTRQIPNKKSQIPNELFDAGMPHPTSPLGEELLPGVFPFRGDRGADSRRTNSDVEIYRMDVKLLGANKNAEVMFEEPTGYYENYYLAHTGEDGVTAKGFQRVVYKNIYRNVDLVLYSPNPAFPQGEGDEIENNKVSPLGGDLEGAYSRGIKYDFIVHPGGNPADIQLRYEGATDIKLVEGALIATTPFGTITEAAPYSYNAETKEEVQSVFKLSGNTLSFGVGNYSGTLVIDPTLHWATYYGGSLGNSAWSLGVATDIYEHVYLCGGTSSTNNIATVGSYQNSLVGTISGYIVKFDSSGTRIWGTYYGASSIGTQFNSLGSYKDGSLYASGFCDSSVTSLITNGAHQTTFGGGAYDAILVKFDSSGQRIWATLYGGAQDELNIVNYVDRNGSIYLGGTTMSNNNIATSGTHKSTHSSNDKQDGFVVKFNSSGVRLWGTYYGGDTSYGGFDPRESVKALTSDLQGNVYIGGWTQSVNGIASNGAHQSTPGGGGQEAFVAKLNGNSGQRIWGTYYGSSSFEEVYSMYCDENNNIYIGGHTGSNNGIATNGTHLSSNPGSSSAFIAKFNINGQRQWGTFYGGTGNVGATTGLGVSPSGSVYITGVTSGNNGIATVNAHSTSYNAGSNDAYIAAFSSVGTLQYGSYYGGTSQEYGITSIYFGQKFGQCIAVSNAGKVYMAGLTTSINNISTNNGHQTVHGSSGAYHDAFLAAWDADTVVYIPQRYTDTVWCPGDTVHILYGANKKFKNGNNFSVQLSDNTGDFSSPITIGTLAATIDDTISCIVPISTPPGAGYRIRIVGSNPVRTSWDNQWDIRINPLPNLVAGSTSPVCTGDSLQLTGSSTSTGVTWLWSGPNSFTSAAKDTFIANAQLIDSGKYILKATLNSTGCSLTDTTTVEMRPTPAKPTAGSNSPVCEFHSIQLTASSTTPGVSYSWAGPGSYGSSTQNPTVTTSANSTHAGDYIATATLNGCSNKDTTTVVVLPKPAKPTAGATNSPLCARQDLQLTASTVTGASYAWYGPSAFTANVQNPIRANIQMGDAGKYYVYATVSGCVSDTDSVAVVVNTDPFVNIFPTPGASICQGQQVIFTAVPTNGGTTSYNWLVNGITTGSTGLTYSTTTLNNGDAVSCAMTSTGTCATAFTDTSNTITMTVQPILSPTVTMAADKMPPWNGGLTVTFTATPTHGGTAPEYQWKRNGQDITGATGATWGVVVNALNANEDICVVLKSSYECAVPDTALSNCITTAFTGVGDIVNNKNIKIYPNPVSGILHIDGAAAGSTIELIDVLGRKCATAQLLNSSMDVSNLVPGVYVIRVNGVVGGRVVKE